MLIKLMTTVVAMVMVGNALAADFTINFNGTMKGEGQVFIYVWNEDIKRFDKGNPFSFNLDPTKQSQTITVPFTKEGAEGKPLYATLTLGGSWEGESWFSGCYRLRNSVSTSFSKDDPQRRMDWRKGDEHTPPPCHPQ